MRHVNGLSQKQMCAVARIVFGAGFFAVRVGPKLGRRCAIRYNVPGHPLMIATAGEGATWSEALNTAARSLGLVATWSA